MNCIVTCGRVFFSENVLHDERSALPLTPVVTKMMKIKFILFIGIKGALSRYCTITLKNLKLPMHQWKP